MLKGRGKKFEIVHVRDSESRLYKTSTILQLIAVAVIKACSVKTHFVLKLVN